MEQELLKRLDRIETELEELRAVYMKVGQAVTWPWLLALLGVIFTPMAAVAGYALLLSVEANQAAVASHDGYVHKDEIQEMRRESKASHQEIANQVRREIDAYSAAMKSEMSAHLKRIDQSLTDIRQTLATKSCK